MRFNNRHNPLQPGIPIGKQIDILRLALYTRRHFAIVQPHRNHEHIVERHPAAAFERMANLRLKAAALVHRVPRETRDEEIGIFNRLLDPVRPVLSREQLLAQVWGYEAALDAGTSTVTVHVRRLREKIERDPSRPEIIRTIWGVGYRFEA